MHVACWQSICACVIAEVRLPALTVDQRATCYIMQVDQGQAELLMAIPRGAVVFSCVFLICFHRGPGHYQLIEIGFKEPAAVQLIQGSEAWQGFRIQEG